MAESIPSPNQIPETSSVTVVETAIKEDEEVPTLRLRLKKPKSDKKVQWTTETVDNEHLNKKKSKCCCIYTKPRSLDEESSSSSSSSDEECEHCKGHIEKKKKKRRKGSVNVPKINDEALNLSMPSTENVDDSKENANI